MDASRLRVNGLLTVAATRVGPPPELASFVAEMMRHLGFEQPVHHSPLELGEHAIRAEEVGFGTAPRHDLVNPRLFPLNSAMRELLGFVVPTRRNASGA